MIGWRMKDAAPLATLARVRLTACAKKRERLRDETLARNGESPQKRRDSEGNDYGVPPEGVVVDEPPPEVPLPEVPDVPLVLPLPLVVPDPLVPLLPPPVAPEPEVVPEPPLGEAPEVVESVPFVEDPESERLHATPPKARAAAMVAIASEYWVFLAFMFILVEVVVASRDDIGLAAWAAAVVERTAP